MHDSKLRIAFIGCVQLSREMLLEVLDSPDAEVVGIVSREQSPFHSDFASLISEAQRRNIPTLNLESNDQARLQAWLQALQPDVLYCFGWPYLLKGSVIKTARLGAVGYHPAELPHNRGRHPLIWAIALGLKTTASTFFLLDEGADSGAILSQESVNIGTDDVGALYQRLIPICRRQVRVLTNQLRTGKFSPQPQSKDVGNTWRKRGPLDGQIDWRMSAPTIHNLVRALTHPYVGAHAMHGGNAFKVWKTEVWPDAPNNLEPGKVLVSSRENFVVKCGEGAIRLVEHEFPEIPKEGSYL